MQLILDPEDRWVGRPARAAAPGNKKPVVLDDALSLLMDSGPVTVNVLANDFDPEGAALSLVSASAALGTAVAEPDDTVTYTPPPGISGFDTVVYEVADDQDQRRTGQINVTINEPQLSVDTTAQNTLVVTSETGLVDITVTLPASFAGTYQIDTADLLGGPVNLVAPDILGTVAPGNTLTGADGLWAFDIGAGTPTQSWQWRRGGVDIAGETSPAYIVQPGDIGPGLALVETLTDSIGQRSQTSAIVAQGFTPAADALLTGWWDASDAATITGVGSGVTSWADKAGGDPLFQNAGSREPTTGARTLNGLNILDFDGGDFLERASSGPASGDIAFHMALIIDSTSNAFEAVLALEATTDFQVDAQAATQFDGRLNLAGAGTSFSLSGGPFSGAFILSTVFDLNAAGTAEVFVSNISRGSTAYTAALDSTAALHLMTNRSKNAWVDGAIAELIVTTDVTNRADYHAYLATKWGLI